VLSPDRWNRVLLVASKVSLFDLLFKSIRRKAVKDFYTASPAKTLSIYRIVEDVLMLLSCWICNLISQYSDRFLGQISGNSKPLLINYYVNVIKVTSQF
jgi:hypothetical protein